MKYLYSLILLSICSVTFAQSDLYVSTGSYVYVDGTAFTSGPTVAPLYVTNDVNIVGTGHIYLRNEAQLLQNPSTINSINKGDGKLSVFQTGTSNTYMYNYWCSPVGVNSGIDYIATGNTVFTPNINFYRETAAPITSSLFGYVGGYNGTATQIANYWLYTFTGTTAPPNDYQDWEGLGAGPGSLASGGLANGTLASGYGFTMKGNPTAAQKYDFRGRPNNGTITTTINLGRETLVGNPYPSAIDARDYIHDGTNFGLIDSATLSFWEQKPGSTSHVLANYEGGYATYTINAAGTVETYTPATYDTYNLDGTLNTTGGLSTSGKTVKRYIPIGQGFMVKGAATGNLRMLNSFRTFQKESAGSSEFFRTGDTLERTEEESSYDENGLFIMPEDYKRFRLNVDFNETYTRQLLQNFHHTATPGEDYGLETRSPEALNSDAYWPQGEKAYNAQAFAFDTELHIPLVLNINQDQLIRFRIFDIQNFDDGQPIFVHDMETGLYVDLRQQNFEINLPSGNYSDRFEIVFQDQSLSTEEFNDDDFLVMQNNNTSELTILNPNQLEIKTVTLFEVSGKRVFSEMNLDVQDRYHFPTKNLSEGVYIAKVTFSNQSSMSKKIVITQNK